MQAPLSQFGSSIAADESGRLMDDLYCVKCHYNLRGIEAEGRCPECGLAVGRTVSGQWLRYCDPGWLAKVWRGLNCLGVSLAALTLLLAMERAGVYRKDSAWPEWLWLYTANGLVATGAVFSSIGFFLSTARDPAKLHEPIITARRAARILLISAVVGITALLAALPHIKRNIDEGAVNIIILSIVASLLVGALCILWHASRLAMRIPSRWLARLTLLDAVLLAPSSLGALMAQYDWAIVRRQLIRWLPQGTSGVSYYDICNWLTPTARGGVIFAGLLLLSLFIWYYVAMRRQAMIARNTWARVPFQSRTTSPV